MNDILTQDLTTGVISLTDNGWMLLNNLVITGVIFASLVIFLVCFKIGKDMTR